jgi:outer membrane protein insertion porin family
VRRGAWLALALSLCAACDDEFIPPRVPTKPGTQAEASPAERREAACKSKELPGPPVTKATDGTTDPPPTGSVARVDVEGATDEARARAAIAIAAGDTLTLPKTQEAMKRLYALGDYEDVRLEAHGSPQGPVLRFVLQKHASLGEIVIHGGTMYDAPELEHVFHAKTGASYDPVAVVAARSTLIDALHQRGFADASLSIVGTRLESGSVDLCIELREGSKVTIDAVSFKGLVKVKEDEVRGLVDTDHGRINTPGGILDPAKIDEAISKMAEVLDAHGLAKGVIQIRTVRSGDKVSLVFEVEEGPVIVVRRYEVKGDLVADVSAYRKLFTLKSKDPFSRAKLLADMTKISELHEKHGRKDLQVQPQTQADDKNSTVDIVLMVIDPKKVKAPPPPPPPAKK